MAGGPDLMNSTMAIQHTSGAATSSMGAHRIPIQPLNMKREPKAAVRTIPQKNLGNLQARLQQGLVFIVFISIFVV